MFLPISHPDAPSSGQVVPRGLQERQRVSPRTRHPPALRQLPCPSRHTAAPGPPIDGSALGVRVHILPRRPSPAPPQTQTLRAPRSARPIHSITPGRASQLRRCLFPEGGDCRAGGFLGAEPHPVPLPPTQAIHTERGPPGAAWGLARSSQTAPPSGQPGHPCAPCSVTPPISHTYVHTPAHTRPTRAAASVCGHGALCVASPCLPPGPARDSPGDDADVEAGPAPGVQEGQEPPLQVGEAVHVALHEAQLVLEQQRDAHLRAEGRGQRAHLRLCPRLPRPRPSSGQGAASASEPVGTRGRACLRTWLGARPRQPEPG